MEGDNGGVPALSPAALAELPHPLWVGGRGAAGHWCSGLRHTTTHSPPRSGASEGSAQQLSLELRPGEYRVLLCVDIGEAKG